MSDFTDLTLGEAKFELSDFLIESTGLAGNSLSAIINAATNTQELNKYVLEVAKDLRDQNAEISNKLIALWLKMKPAIID